MGGKGKSKGKMREIAFAKSRQKTVEEQINLQLPEVQKGLIIWLMQQPDGKAEAGKFKQEMYRLFEDVADMKMGDCRTSVDRLGLMAMAKSGLFSCPKGWGLHDPIMLSASGQQYAAVYKNEVDAIAQREAQVLAQERAQADAQARIQAQAEALGQALAQDRARMEAPAPSASSSGQPLALTNADEEDDDEDSMERAAKKARLANLTPSGSEDEATAPSQISSEQLLQQALAFDQNSYSL